MCILASSEHKAASNSRQSDLSRLRKSVRQDPAEATAQAMIKMDSSDLGVIVLVRCSSTIVHIPYNDAASLLPNGAFALSIYNQ